MKIVIATPLYPPEIGGPSLYAFNIAEALKAQGHTIAVVRYGALKRFPTGIRHMLYAWKLLFSAFAADAIIAFDTYSVGMPAAFVSTLTRTPLLIRIGGDFLWERYVERTGELVPLPYFYGMREKKWSRKEHVIFRNTKWVLSRAIAAFNTAWLRDIWRDAYELEPARLHVVDNEIEPCAGTQNPARKNFLFYSRQIAIKNHPAFRRAFARAWARHPEIELEEGIVPHEELMQRVKDCYAIVVPSISDVAPNYILDALRFGKPFLLTKHSGYAERFGEYGVIVDPQDEANMMRGVAELATPEIYARLQARITGFKERHTYEDIAREFLALISR